MRYVYNINIDIFNKGTKLWENNIYSYTIIANHDLIYKKPNGSYYR